MASDSTYQPLIYRKQGGSEMVFAAGSTLTMNTAIDNSGAGTQTSTTGSAWTTGSTWIANSAVGGTYWKALTSSTAASGDYACLRPRARSNGAGNAICVNASASAGQNNHGDLYAVQGYAQPNAYTNNSASNIVNGVYSCIDAGGASSGRRWSLWTDEHSTTKASAGHYLHRLSHNGTVAIDGLWTVYGGGRLPLFINIEDATPGFVAATTGTFTTPDLTLACKVDGTAYLLPLYLAADA